MRYQRIGILLAGVLVAASVAIGASPGLATAGGADTVSGGAFGAAATGLVTLAPTPSVTLPAGGAAQNASVANVNVATLLTAGVITTTSSAASVGTAAETVQSQAQVANVDTTIAALSHVVTATAVTTSCMSSATGSTGTTNIVGLSLLGVPVVLPAVIPANYNVTLPAELAPLLTLQLNATTLSNGLNTTGITDDGIAITLLGSTQTVTIAQARCGAAGPDVNAASILPVVSSITPVQGPTIGGTVVTVTGSGFTGATAVNFGSNPGTGVTVTSPTTLTVISPPHSAGSVPVTVTAPSGTSSTSGTFNYHDSISTGPPTITGSSPSSGPPSGGSTVTITGTGLCGLISVTFGGVASGSVTVNATCTTITASAPPGTGTVPITVTTIGGTSTSPTDFTYITPGYWMTASDGGVFSFGGAQFFGSMGGHPLNQPIVAMANTPDHQGYWLFAADGGVFAFGDAAFFGSVPGVLVPAGRTLNAPIVAAEASPDGHGYRMFAADGGVFDFGDAQYVGSLPGLKVTPNKPVVAATSNPLGQGYWLVAGDGGVFSFGDAGFHGSEGGSTLNSPIASMSADSTGQGYWIFGADGGVYSFGDTSYYGSMGGQPLNKPITAGVATSDSHGYWEFATDGGVFTFGNAPFEGSLGSLHLNQPIVGGDGW